MSQIQRNPITLFSAVTLTAAYTGNVGVTQAVASENQLTLHIGYTMGAAETANSLEFKVEFSDDDTTWYQETMSTLNSGTDTLVLLEHSFTATQAAATYDYFEFTMPINSKYFRVSLKETGIASNGGTCSVESIVSYI